VIQVSRSGAAAAIKTLSNREADGKALSTSEKKIGRRKADTAQTESDHEDAEDGEDVGDGEDAEDGESSSASTEAVEQAALNSESSTSEHLRSEKPANKFRSVRLSSKFGTSGLVCKAFSAVHVCTALHVHGLITPGVIAVALRYIHSLHPGAA